MSNVVESVDAGISTVTLAFKFSQSFLRQYSPVMFRLLAVTTLLVKAILGNISFGSDDSSADFDGSERRERSGILWE